MASTCGNALKHIRSPMSPEHLLLGWSAAEPDADSGARGCIIFQGVVTRRVRLQVKACIALAAGCPVRRFGAWAQSFGRTSREAPPSEHHSTDRPD